MHLKRILRYRFKIKFEEKRSEELKFDKFQEKVFQNNEIFASIFE